MGKRREMTIQKHSMSGLIFFTTHKCFIQWDSSVQNMPLVYSYYGNEVNVR